MVVVLLLALVVVRGETGGGVDKAGVNNERGGRTGTGDGDMILWLMTEYP